MFCGREADTTAILSKMHAPGTLAVCITGSPGLGKSAVARTIGGRLANSSTIVRVVDLRDAYDLAAVCKRFHAELGMPDATPLVDIPPECAARAQLLILDNVEDPLEGSAHGAFVALVVALMARAPSLRLMLTCRMDPRLSERSETAVALTTPGITCVSLRELPTHEACDMARKIAVDMAVDLTCDLAGDLAVDLAGDLAGDKVRAVRIAHVIT